MCRTAPPAVLPRSFFHFFSHGTPCQLAFLSNPPRTGGLRVGPRPPALPLRTQQPLPTCLLLLSSRWPTCPTTTTCSSSQVRGAPTACAHSTCPRDPAHPSAPPSHRQAGQAGRGLWLPAGVICALHFLVCAALLSSLFILLPTCSPLNASSQINRMTTTACACPVPSHLPPTQLLASLLNQCRCSRG